MYSQEMIGWILGGGGAVACYIAGVILNKREWRRQMSGTATMRQVAALDVEYARAIARQEAVLATLPKECPRCSSETALFASTVGQPDCRWCGYRFRQGDLRRLTR